MYENAVSWVDYLTGERLTGWLISQSYCPVNNRWMLLVAGQDGKFHNVPHDGLEVQSLWWEGSIAIGGDDEEDDEAE